MNVKAVWNSLVNISGISKTKLDHRAKAEASADKDTQLGHGQEEASQHRMNDEQAQEVLEYFKEIDGVKENNLQVRLDKSTDRFVIYVEDVEGKVVRRIPENEMWFLFNRKNSTDTKKGQILNKAM
jgi:uncharacterized FlaG/YvyC family protein